MVPKVTKQGKEKEQAKECKLEGKSTLEIETLPCVDDTLLVGEVDAFVEHFAEHFACFVGHFVVASALNFVAVVAVDKIVDIELAPKLVVVEVVKLEVGAEVVAAVVEFVEVVGEVDLPLNFAGAFAVVEGVVVVEFLVVGVDSEFVVAFVVVEEFVVGGDSSFDFVVVAYGFVVKIVVDHSSLVDFVVEIEVVVKIVAAVDFGGYRVGVGVFDYELDCELENALIGLPQDQCSYFHVVVALDFEPFVVVGNFVAVKKHVTSFDLNCYYPFREH